MKPLIRDARNYESSKEGDAPRWQNASIFAEVCVKINQLRYINDVKWLADRVDIR